ncbi:MAG TPA: phosphate ABC transporter substrate-binding protein PstS [Pseudonocardiaceae bacterium]|nr:phosphate ABC transporter substrate-binding protein PstS [Pseudonocardiaceae bacterium]
MKINRHGAAVLGLAAAGALMLAACGTDNNTGAGATSSSSGGDPASAASSITCPSGSANLTLSGSTAQANAISVWAKNFENACSGVNVNNGLGGSGQGVSQFQAGSVDFAGSDYPLAATDMPKANARCKTGDAINIPLVPGPIAVGFNVPGVTTLKLSASNLAKIFSGKITKWNDPAIAKDNSGVSLPAMGIQTFHRSDTSGTSFNFSNYLANEAKTDWTYGTNKQWPGPGGQGDKGSALVSQDVKKTPGGIGYFELSYAQQQSIPYAQVSNAAGTFVPLTQENASNFIGKAQVVGTGNNLTLSFDYADTGATDYPNVLVTYEIVCQSGNDASKLPALKAFLGYAASADGQKAILSDGYVSLPENIRTKVASAIDSLK